MSFTNALFDPMLDGGTAVATRASLHATGDLDTSASPDDEISGGGYERQEVSWASASGGSVSTSGPLTFNVPGGEEISHLGLWTSDEEWLGSLRLAELQPFPTAGTLTVDPATLELEN